MEFSDTLELSSALRRTVEDAYGYVRVRGEVSGFKGASPSGHVYFRLKDDKAVLEAVIWKGTFGRMRVRPEEGLDVIVSGKLTIFAGSSKYQIVIDSLEPAGIGALMKLSPRSARKSSPPKACSTRRASSCCHSCPGSSAWLHRPPVR